MPTPKERRIIKLGGREIIVEKCEDNGSRIFIGYGYFDLKARPSRITKLVRVMKSWTELYEYLTIRKQVERAYNGC